MATISRIPSEEPGSNPGRRIAHEILNRGQMRMVATGRAPGVKARPHVTSPCGSPFDVVTPI